MAVLLESRERVEQQRESRIRRTVDAAWLSDLTPKSNRGKFWNMPPEAPRSSAHHAGIMRAGLGGLDMLEVRDTVPSVSSRLPVRPVLLDGLINC